MHGEKVDTEAEHVSGMMRRTCTGIAIISVHCIYIICTVVESDKTL